MQAVDLGSCQEKGDEEGEVRKACLFELGSKKVNVSASSRRPRAGASESKRDTQWPKMNVITGKTIKESQVRAAYQKGWWGLGWSWGHTFGYNFQGGVII